MNVDGLVSISENYTIEQINYVVSLISEISNSIVESLDNDIPIFQPNISNQINDINEYLKCFQTSQGAVFTLYVDQPTANSNESWSGNPLNPNVGHTFISIKQSGIRRVLGFYPLNEVSLNDPSTTGSFVNDSAHEFDVSISFNINSVQLTNLVNYIKQNANTTYDLNTYNCTDFGMISSEQVGVTLPSAFGTWGVTGVGSGGGDNPGQLGQNIRNMPNRDGVTKNTSGGISLSNIGNCP